MLINEETIEVLNKLIQKMFQHNRTLDNFLGFSNVAWSWSNFSTYFHKPYAHVFPLFADYVADIELRYNVVPKYYETLRDTRQFSSMEDFFSENLREHKETYDLIKNGISIATLNGDLNVETDLKYLLRLWNDMMAQAILLLDKSKSCGESNKFLFDSFSEQYYTIESVKNKLEEL